MLTREEVDRRLDRLGSDNDAIAQALVEMDGHAGHRLLRGAALAGITERRWAETSAAMAALWQQFATYGGLLGQAREVRARRSRPNDDDLAELTALLTDPVVELDSEHVPIERRGLTGPAQVTERITVTELLDRMKASFAVVIGVLAAADTAWSAAIARLDPLTDELHEVSVLAESVAAGDRATSATLDRLRAALDEARERVVTDVLAVAADDPLPRIAAEVAGLRTRLADLAVVRDTVDTRLAELDGLLSDIEAAEATAEQTWTAVVEKIATPGLPAPTGERSARLRPRLGALARRRDEGDWSRLAAEAGELERDATTALDDARRSLRAISGLLDRRAELRGRLEAYRVKAARLGHGEDLALEKAYAQAHHVLFTAPCDLAAATRALNRYQQALQDRERPPRPAAEEGSA